MSLETALQIVLGVTPVPGLSEAYTLFKFIVSSVQGVRESKKQLEVLAAAVGQLLATLDVEFRSSRLIVANCRGQLAELKILLEDIYRFVDKEQSKGFFKSLLTKDSRIASIEAYYRRIGMSVNTFQISGLLSIQSMLGKNEVARNEDADVLNARLKALEQNQVHLRETLEIKQDNMIAMMACIQRRLDGQQINPPEQKFYSHTLQYLTTMSGQQVKLEDWMIASFDVEYGTEIGVGGFGKVYRGTWSRTDVAIKVLHTVAGVTPSLALLRKEIDIWLTLRHPNILQFLGANTLDNKPFIVMPYIPSNAREFLKQQPTFDPVYITMYTLALTYFNLGQYKEAEKLWVTVMMKRKQVLGEDHPDTLRTMYNLALAYFNLGQYKEAEKLRVTVMMKQKQVLGEDHPDTLLTMENVAHTYLCLGQYKEAKKLGVTVMMKQKQVLGEDHPDTLQTMGNLVQTYLKLGKSNEAEELAVAVIQKQKQVLGEDHPQTLWTMGNLASTYSALGREQEAEELEVTVMKKQKQVLGEYHPDTLQTMGNLALIYSKLGRRKEAEELGMTVMKKWKQVLGEDHPDTLQTMHNVAHTYLLMMKRKRVLGEDHPDTLLTMENVAHTYSALGRHKEAEELRVTVMKKQKQVLGEDHPSTLLTMGNLATTYFNLDRYKDAEELEVMVMKKRKQVLGEDHPDTLGTMGNLADTYLKLGKSKEAEELAVTVTQKQKQVLGEAHPDTLWAMEVLVCIYKEQGKLAEAQSLSDTIKRIKIRQMVPLSVL
ncbi:hypothetical protein FB451DRAFT_1549555 [Mycena latifolia]|nr:hypothetical protein FB451DRAFT_1549555 [Mycena latifolia]